MTSLAFPDLNVWIALTLTSHEHHPIAWKWYRSQARDRELVFCRITQMGFLRLLTTESVAKHETLNQNQAWAAYDQWLNKGGCIYREEPLGTDLEFRDFTNQSTPNPKGWTDSYLAAFAAAGSMSLVTFDRSLSLRAKQAILLVPGS